MASNSVVELRPAPKVQGLREASVLAVGGRNRFTMFEAFKLANERGLTIESLRPAQRRLHGTGGFDDRYPVRTGTLVLSAPPNMSFSDSDSETRGPDRGKYFRYVDPNTKEVFRAEIQEPDRNVKNRAICVAHQIVDGQPNIAIHPDTKPREFFVEIRYPVGVTIVDDYARENGAFIITNEHGLATGEKAGKDVKAGLTPDAFWFHRGGTFFRNEKGETGVSREKVQFGWHQRPGERVESFQLLEVDRMQGNFLGCPIIGFEVALFFNRHQVSLYWPSQEAAVHIYPEAGK